MKICIAVLLSFTLSFPAWAEEAPCVTGFRLENADFYSHTGNLQVLEGISNFGLYAGLPGGAACVILARRSWWGIVACAAAGITVTGASFVGGNMAAAAIERARAIQQMEDSFLMYQVYRAGKMGEASTSVDVQILVNGLGIEGLDPEWAADQVVDLMESGELCNGGSTPTVGYWNMLEIIKRRN